MDILKGNYILDSLPQHGSRLKGQAGFVMWAALAILLALALGVIVGQGHRLLSSPFVDSDIFIGRSIQRPRDNISTLFPLRVFVPTTESEPTNNNQTKSEVRNSYVTDLKVTQQRRLGIGIAGFLLLCFGIFLFNNEESVIGIALSLFGLFIALYGPSLLNIAR